MRNLKNKNLRIVRENEEPMEKKDPTDKIVAEIMTELNNEDITLEEMEEKVQEHKKRFRRRIITGAVAAAALAATVFLVIYLQTYTKVRVSEAYALSGAAGSSYEEFADGVLKYSRDGVAYLNQKGEEQWNQPYQIKNPFVDVNGASAAIADKGGNDIMVVQADGVKGEIHTTLPIEKISVSEQGIVCAVLKNESTPQIICYDTAGNILVEHKSSLDGTGYPMDVALSDDGELMQVVYLNVKGGKITSRVAYYNFGKKGEEKADHQVAGKDYEDSVIASGFFLNKSVSAAVGDHCITLFRGGDVPKEVTTITIDKEIQSVFHSDKYIGLILKNEGKSGYELRLYSASGKQALSKEFSGTYQNAKISGGQVILYDGKKCCMFLRSGVQKFEGEMDNNILEIFPIAGVNKYIVMNANGMEDVRLVK